jgi:hypothetical protein
VHASIIFVDAGAAAGGDGQSWAAAYDYLQDALAAASSGDQIWVAKQSIQDGVLESRYSILEGPGTLNLSLDSTLRVTGLPPRILSWDC